MRSAASLSDIVSLPERQSRGQHEQPPSFYSGFKRPTTLVCAPRCRGSLPINYLSPPELLSGCAPRPTPSMGGCVSGHFRPHREVAQCDMTGLARVNLHHKQVHTWRRTSNLSITPPPPSAASTSWIFFFLFLSPREEFRLYWARGKLKYYVPPVHCIFSYRINLRVVNTFSVRRKWTRSCLMLVASLFLLMTLLQLSVLR